MKTDARFAALCLILAVLGCERQSSVPAVTAGADTVRMPVGWEVAPGAHPAADSLGDVSGVAVDAGGNVYVSDFLTARIWIFGPDGGLRASMGGKGEGPGEFEAPTGPAVGPDGRLYVRDVYRVSVFGPDSVSGLLTRIEDTFEGPVYADWTSRRATRFDENGALLYPGKRWRDDGTAAPYVIRFTPAGVPTDTLWVPDHATAPQVTAWVRTGPGGGRMLRGLSHVPFAPLPAWDVTAAGTVISGDGLSYDLVETDHQGEVVARFHRALEPDDIPADERRDSVAALRARLDSVPVALDRVEGLTEEVRSLAVPERYPAYMAVYVGRDGDVWVRRWPVGGGNRTVFDVFARDGDYRHTVLLPRAIRVEPTPVLSSTGVVGVMTHPLTDESIIVRFGDPGLTAGSPEAREP